MNDGALQYSSEVLELGSGMNTEALCRECMTECITIVIIILAARMSHAERQKPKL
jgi:hypothetical protein